MRALIAPAVACAALLGAAPAALAHAGSPASVASDWSARLSGVRPAVAGLQATAVGGDIELRLRVPPRRTVVVRGVEDEPFLRFSDGRVEANERSPTALLARVLSHADTAGGTPAWRQVARGRRYSWHESRLRPRAATRDGRISAIAIPLTVDGAAASITGDSWHRKAPTAALWLLPLAVLAIGVAVTLLRARLPRAVLIGLGAVALTPTVALIAGATLYAPHSAAGAAAQLVVAAAFGAALLAALALLARPRVAFAALAAGAVCVLYAAASFPLLTHGFPLTRLPAGPARAGEIAALVAGGALGAAGARELAASLTPRAGGGPPGVGSVTAT